MKNIETTLYKLFCGCFALMLLVFMMINGYVLALSVLIITFIISYNKLFSFSHFTLHLFLVGMILRIIIILFLHPPITSDFLALYNAAENLLEGNIALNENSSYFSLWAYQSAFVVWEALWLKLWNDPICLELINALLSTGCKCQPLFYIVR